MINEYKDKIEVTSLSRKQRQDLWVIGEFVRQQKELYYSDTWSIELRILSISKPWVRSIAMGKARGMYEFGVKLSLSLIDEIAEVYRLSWDAYNECRDLKGQIDRYKQRYERYPVPVYADKIYRMREGTAVLLGIWDTIIGAETLKTLQGNEKKKILQSNEE